MKELWRINKYLIKYKGLLSLGILFTVISNIFVIIPAQLVRIAIDYVVESFALFAPLDKGGIGELAREYFLESVFIFGIFTQKFLNRISPFKDCTLIRAFLFIEFKRKLI
mgnify:CR=1 FL=1